MNNPETPRCLLGLQFGKLIRSLVASVLACWMLGGSLLPDLGIDQSAHWSDLMLHYQQHRQTDPDLSFTDVLNMHYGANSEH